MDEIAITVKDLKIRYKSVQAYSIKKSLLRMKNAETKEFEAVRGISFEVKQGEILGITGKNGSGKSTMLRALANIFSADEGSIDLHGHTVSLLAIGVGFMKDLTGRENIMLSGMLLGFTEDQVREKMPEIIDFAGLGKFIDMPVRTYSSGMYSKLAFSITAILETEIMLIDVSQEMLVSQANALCMALAKSGNYEAYVILRCFMMALWCGVYGVVVICVSSIVKNAGMSIVLVIAVRYMINALCNVLGIEAVYRPSSWFAMDNSAFSDAWTFVLCLGYVIIVTGVAGMIFKRNVTKKVQRG